MSGRRHEMYRELDEYLTQRRKNAPQPAPPKTGWFSKPRTEEPPMDADTAETDEYDEPREGWWTKFKKSFASKPAEPEMQEVPEQEMQMPTTNPAEEDMKEVARIALTVLRKMPPEMVREFKATSDYEKFKELLRKYNMIK